MPINTNYWTTEDYANYGMIDPNTGGLTDQGMGAMNTGSYTPPQQQGAGWQQAAGAGIGAILNLAPKLIGMAEQRRTNKRIAKIQAELEAKQWADNLKNYSEAQGDILRAGDRGRPGLSADMADRGLANSSIKTQEMGDLDYALERRMDALMRKKAQEVYGREAAMAIAKIQKKSEKRQYYLAIASEVGNAIGSVANAGVGMAASDKKTKENIKPANASALDQVIDTPVKSWNYKKDPVNKHIGPMAQDVKKNMGDEVAPEGKTIDVVSMNGMLMKAVQELAAEVKALKGKK